jgi:hypothetical protein
LAVVAGKKSGGRIGKRLSMADAPCATSGLSCTREIRNLTTPVRTSTTRSRGIRRTDMKQFKEIKAILGAINEEAALADGYEAALIGYVDQFGRPTVALYDREKCIEILMTRDKMEHGEAVEFFEFNTLGASVGENTPAFATLLVKKARK